MEEEEEEGKDGRGGGGSKGWSPDHPCHLLPLLRIRGKITHSTVTVSGYAVSAVVECVSGECAPGSRACLFHHDRLDRLS